MQYIAVAGLNGLPEAAAKLIFLLSIIETL
jgi:hypothetical protein